jgi:hypothetical protein
LRSITPPKLTGASLSGEFECIKGSTSIIDFVSDVEVDFVVYY